ncbi:MAG: amidase family protein, partial [Patescibacteria group bacterium]
CSSEKMCSSTDSPGPLGKTVKDCATILKIIAGKDYHDGTSSNEIRNDYSNFSFSNLNNIKIGIPKNYFSYPMEEGIKEKVTDSINALAKLGAKIIEVNLMDPKYAIAVYTIIQRAEVSSNLSRFDGIRYGNPRSSFGHEAQRRILLGTYVLSAGYYDKYYQKAQKVRTLICRDFDRVFKSVDLVVSPVSPTLPLKIGSTVDQSMFGEIADALVESSSLVGLPGISVPAGFVNGLPVGMQLVGPKFSEKLILEVANLYEKEVDFSRFKPNL